MILGILMGLLTWKTPLLKPSFQPVTHGGWLLARKKSIMCLVNKDTVVFIERKLYEASIQEHRPDTKKNGRVGEDWDPLISPDTVTQYPSGIHPVTQIICFIYIYPI